MSEWHSTLKKFFLFDIKNKKNQKMGSASTKNLNIGWGLAVGIPTAIGLLYLGVMHHKSGDVNGDGKKWPWKSFFAIWLSLLALALLVMGLGFYKPYLDNREELIKLVSDNMAKFTAVPSDGGVNVPVPKEVVTKVIDDDEKLEHDDVKSVLEDVKEGKFDTTGVANFVKYLSEAWSFGTVYATPKVPDSGYGMQW
jgi:hypothetical protein